MAIQGCPSVLHQTTIQKTRASLLKNILGMSDTFMKLPKITILDICYYSKI